MAESVLMVKRSWNCVYVFHVAFNSDSIPTKIVTDVR